MTDPPRHLRYWAKTSKSDPEVYHPVVFHCLDVAAVGRTLLEARPSSLRRLAVVSGFSEAFVLDLVTLLLSFHDLGKLADGFQCQRSELMVRLQGGYRWATYDTTHWRHDTVGYVALETRLDADGLGGLVDSPWRDRFARTWLAAAMGHHGIPPMLDVTRHRARSMAKQFPPEVDADLDATLAELRERFLPEPLAISDEDAMRRQLAVSSWLLAGLAVEADWIGSNSEWFPFFAEPLGVVEYFEQQALPRARVAVKDAGLVERQVARRVPFSDLWRELPRPTPLQRLCDELPLYEGPQLVVIEEVTGGGKTEAAFTLAHRLIAEGRAEGLYIGLPTMATANAMYDRLEKAYRRLFAEGSEPSLVLAHARRHLRLALEEAAKKESRSELDSAGAQCAAWLADSRKKALLADVGIGTIDQALLGALQARHQSLRLWGLAGKVLIVDEVHAADDYMQGLLACLLEAHAAFGGCAVLLSATLSSRQRDKLCQAFAEGADWERPSISDRRYPAVVQVSREGASVHAVEARREASREIAVHLLADAGAVDAQIQATLAAGGCACWIRNTVADAVETWERWSQRLGAERVTLFHARFTVDDRHAIERGIREHFGPASGPAERSGRLVVATQVVEQSLDLDFDLLVSDLAPIDLLIQRAGRLRRHRRDAQGTPIDREDERGEAVLLVHSPQPAADCSADWVKAALPGTAVIYPDHGALWLGARWLADRGRLRIPGDLRDLIEHVYGGEAEEEIPDALQEATLAAEGRRRADASVAKVNEIDFSAGYQPAGGMSTWRDDVATPTRLGEPTTTVRLARYVDGRVLPWHDVDEYPWDRSQVGVRQSLVAAEWPADQTLITAAKAGMKDEGRHVVVVILRPQPDGGWIGHAQVDRANVGLTYNARRGLVVVKE